MVNTPQQIDRCNQAPDWTLVATVSQSVLPLSHRESAPQCVPRPHIPLSAFVDTDEAGALGDKAVYEDEYDDSAIIVVEDGDGESQPEFDTPLETSQALDEVESHSEDGRPFSCHSTLEECAEGQPLASQLNLSLSILVTDQPRILGQETAMPPIESSGITSFAVRTDEAAELLEHTATEIIDQPFNQTNKGIEREYLADQQPQAISRNLPIQECYREAAAVLERLIDSKAAKTVLMVVTHCDEPEQTRRDLSLGVSVTRFTFPLALALSAKRRVLLVDLVSNDVCLDLGFRSGAGILGVACGRLSPAEALLATASPQVDLLPFGAVEFEQNTERSLDSVRLATAITTLARGYDLVLIMAAFDSLIEEFRWARTIDVAVLAAPCGAISVNAVKAACKRLELIGIQPAGILLLDSASRAFSDSTD